MKNPKIADKFLSMADKLSGDIADRRSHINGMLANTNRRRGQRDQALLDLRSMERLESALRNLSDAWAVGEVPEVLAGVKTKTLVERLIKRDNFPDADYDPTLNKAFIKAGLTPENCTAAHLAVREFISEDAGQETPEDKLRKLEERAFSYKIAGFFPTPPDLIKKMAAETLPLAGRLIDGCRILEPSAGHGSIADFIKSTWPDCDLHTCEVNMTLREILTMKGHELIADDCLTLDPAEHQYDLIMMNPPFERGQDMQHVMHCFNLLAPGGRLISIVSGSCLTNSTKKHDAFRDWFDEKGGRVIDVEDGAFKKAQVSTGVKTHIIVLDSDKTFEIEPDPPSEVPETSAYDKAIEATQTVSADLALTPYQSYLKLVEQYPDHLILMQMGDFYEAFGDHAIRLGKVAGVIVTKRKVGRNTTQMAGFPVNACNTYITALLEAGISVGICNNLTPKEQLFSEVTRVWASPPKLEEDRTIQLSLGL